MQAKVEGATTGRKRRCVSCDALLTGPYCSRCGERVVDAEELTLRHFLGHTVAHELLHLDGALWRTLRLLFMRPGALSLEYAAGRRRPYVNPFRLLLIAIVAYALMASSGFIATWNLGPVTMSIAPAIVKRSLSVQDTIAQIDPYGLLRRQLAAKRERLASEGARVHNAARCLSRPANDAGPRAVRRDRLGRLQREPVYRLAERSDQPGLAETPHRERCPAERHERFLRCTSRDDERPSDHGAVC